MTVADIADQYISSEIHILKLKASSIARYLEVSPEADWKETLEKTLKLNPEFIGAAILDFYSGLVSAGGEAPAPEEIAGDEMIREAFLGRKIISTTIPAGDEVMFYIAIPLEFSEGRILLLTLPGMHFSNRLSSFVIWETGHIFIDDAEGYVIANIREQWVKQRINFINMAETDNQYEGIASVLKLMLQGNKGIGHFSIAGVPRICAYMPISGSEEGWCLGVIAPLPESPLRNVDRGLLIIGIVSLVFNIIAAIIASLFIKKPFEETARLKETAELNSRYKSTFLANMSHEMRTPLNVVVGLTNLRMEDKELSGEIKEDIRKINKAGELLMGIVNDVLDISKIEAGKLELTQEEYETASLLNDVIMLNIIRIQSKPVSFKVEVYEDLPRSLLGDELRVKQIFNNLLSNAFKYTKKGCVTLSIVSASEGEDYIRLYASISDTGIGILPEDIEKLFTDYSQVNIKANRYIEGTGLGLPITKTLVELMDGGISVESEYGKGSTFSVSIKQKVANRDGIGNEVADNLRNFSYSDEKQHASVNLVRPDLSNARVLVVDDFQTNLDVAEGMLRKYKMKVDCVTSGIKAVEIVKCGEPVYDAIFMDHMMPEMDGIEATQRIRSLDSEYARSIPIISLTANALAGSEEMFLEKGFNDFLSKPVSILKLDTIVKKYIRKKPKIPGVNMEAALELCGGEMDLLKAILKSFAVNTPEAIVKMRNPTMETLPEYAINVHGLKSICANIAADDLSKRAKNMEMMAKSGDLTGVRAMNNELLSDAEILINNIKAWLG